MQKFGKRERWLLLLVAIIVLVVALFSVYQLLITSHTYPQDSFEAESNVALKGVVTSIEENYKADGFAVNSYHIYRFLIRINITEITWTEENIEDWGISVADGTLNGWNITSIGYDNPDEPNLQIGQTIECKGHYVAVTDMPSSFKITVSPSINESYLRTL